MAFTPEGLLFHVWQANYGDEALRNDEICTGKRLTWEELVFVFDESFPTEVAQYLRLRPADKAAALDCWRDKMVALMDELVQMPQNGGAGH